MRSGSAGAYFVGADAECRRERIAEQFLCKPSSAEGLHGEEGDFLASRVSSVLALGRLRAEPFDSCGKSRTLRGEPVEIGHEHHPIGVGVQEHLLKHLDDQIVVIHHRFDRQCRHGKLSQLIGESLAVEFVGKVRGGEMLQALLLGTMHKIGPNLVVGGL